MTLLGLIAGVLLLLVLTLDVYATVFVPRGRAGPLTWRLYRWSWKVWRSIGERLAVQRRRTWLAQFGSLLVPITIINWAVLLVISFALIYVPWIAGFSISPRSSGPMPDWAVALYYSAYSAVTLGVGDVVPNGSAPRLLAVMEAGFGLAMITAAISYLLSVYSARTQGVVVALAISRFIGHDDDQDAASALIGLVRAHGERDATDWLGRTAMSLTTFVEMEGQYPQINYFHEPDDNRAFPVALFDLLAFLTICRSMLDPEQYPELARGPTTLAVYRIGVHFLNESSSIPTMGENDLRHERRRRYEEGRARLESAGVALRPDAQAWPDYDALRQRWDMPDKRMRLWLGYLSLRDAR